MGATASKPVTIYSQELPDSRVGSRGVVRVTDIPTAYKPHETLYTMLMDRKAVDDGSRPLFGTRKVIDKLTGERGEYEWVTYREFLTHVEATASGMAGPLLNIRRGDRVGVFSKNRYEWVLVEHATSRMSFILVPLYDTLGPNSVPYILNHTEMTTVFCAKEQFRTLMNCAHECTHLHTIVQFEPEIDEAQKQLAEANKIKLLTLAEIVAHGSANLVPADPPAPEDVCTICYTSGTTGNPKGVMLTHANFAAQVGAGHNLTPLFPTDVHLSYLPLAHIFERTVQGNAIRQGGAIGFYQGDVAKLVDDLAVLKPTIFPTVPRLMNRIYDRITLGVNSAGGVKKFLFDQAFAAKKAYISDGYLTHGLWDPLVFDKVKVLLGGNIRFILNGSAPVTKEVKELFQIVFSCPVIEGYGLTETTAGVACSTFAMPPGNHVGIPLSTIQLRLDDVPEMNYTNDDQPCPRGEILARGPTIFKGYYKQPELTAEVLDADGWFRTGDIGQWNADGTLSIIDRKKNIFKLSQGEYVAPEKIEGIYGKTPFVAQVYVHGDTLRNYLVAIVVPDPDVLAKWAADNGKTGENATIAKLCQDSKLQKDVADSLEEAGKAAKLFRFERVQKIYLHSEPFAVETGLLTPTFKLKRPQLAAYFAKNIADMYNEE